MSDKKKGLVPKLRFPEFRDAEGWDEKPLGKLLSIGNGRDHKHLPDGDVPVYGSGGYMRSVNDYLYDGESVCIGRKGTIDKPIFLSGKFWTVDTLFYTHSFNNCLPSFAYTLFQNINWLKHNEAGGVPSLSKTNIEKIKVCIPQRNEQQKIADCLCSLDTLIGAQADKVDSLKTHKKGLMQQLFPCEGESLPRMRFADFQDEDDWKEYTIEEVAGFRRGSFPQPYGLPEWYDDENGFPFVQVFDVSDDMKLKPYTKRKISALAAQQSVFIKKGTLIITIQGSIGRVAVTQYDAYIDRTLLIFQKFKKPVEKLFFAYVIQMLFEIERHKAPGGIIKTITKEALSSFIVKLPSKDEQQKIADCLSSLDELIAAEADKLEALKTHKKGLMQQLFPVLDEVAL